MAERTDAAREAVFSFGRCPEVDVTLGRNTGSRCISCFVSSLTFFFWGGQFLHQSGPALAENYQPGW